LDFDKFDVVAPILWKPSKALQQSPELPGLQFYTNGQPAPGLPTIEIHGIDHNPLCRQTLDPISVGAIYCLKHYKHLQLCPERKCKIGMGKTYTQFYRKWSEVKNKLY
jgi:hypothetical protein